MSFRLKLSFLYLFISAAIFNNSYAQSGDTDWPKITSENKPWTRWWWHGSAVDKENLKWNLDEIARVGFGGVEIIPIYGVKNNESKEIEYLSPQWMEMLKYTYDRAKQLGMKVDFNTGTGWPFGGPKVTKQDAATCAIFQTYQIKEGENFDKKIIPEKRHKGAHLSIVIGYNDLGDKIDLTDYVRSDGSLIWKAPNGNWIVIAQFINKTGQLVKRAAHGGEGVVLDHFSKHALNNYLDWFDTAFSSSGMKYPNTFFNDSYEVYGADWTEDFLSEFESRRGYKLQDYFPELLRQNGNKEMCARVVSDYRETISDLVLENFVEPWTAWAHSKGSLTRNQAHGAPANILDLYAASDIPECELWSTFFDIPELKYDSWMKPNSANPMGIKFASSAAHIAGKNYTSSETFTWLTEHFRTSLSQCKPMLDMLFWAGINHVYFHGTPYTPKDAKWPGWLFYASVNFSPLLPIWNDLPAMNEYITRCQSFLQYGKPDNEVLVYFPMYDMWHDKDGLFMPFEISKESLPLLYTVAEVARGNGYEVDYISDRYISKATVDKGDIVLPGGRFKTLIIPSCKIIPTETLSKLLDLAKSGADIIFFDKVPSDVPGLKNMKQRKMELNNLLKEASIKELDFAQVQKTKYHKGSILSGCDLSAMFDLCNLKQEEDLARLGVKYVRRSYDKGHIYYLALLDNKPLDSWVSLGTETSSAMIFNPLTGNKGVADIQNGKIYLQMKPGQSIIVKTFTNQSMSDPKYPFYEQVAKSMLLRGDWKFRFTQGIPIINGEFEMKGDPISWTELPVDSAKVYAGTGRYTLFFDLPYSDADQWQLDLEKLAESARVYVNGHDAGTVWSLPYTINIGHFLKSGTNKIEIDVTNLPSNRIRDYDMRGEDWRIFKDINIVNISYNESIYNTWDVESSGLTSSVTLTPLKVKIP